MRRKLDLSRLFVLAKGRLGIMRSGWNQLNLRSLGNTLSLVALLSAIALCAPEVMSQEHNRGNGTQRTAPQVAKETVVDAEQLINALENHNSPPIMTKISWGRPTFDKKYNWSEYNRVDTVIDLLVVHAEELWPHLLRHLNDKQYCITYYSDGSEDDGINYSVGLVCRDVVYGYLVQGYRRHLWIVCGAVSRPEETDRALHVSWEKIGTTMRDWCEERKKKPLCELQIEMCEWAIAKVAKLKDVSDKEREPFIKAVRAEIVELRTSKKVARFPGFHGEKYVRYRPGVPGIKTGT
jgi:hypothetical protein